MTEHTNPDCPGDDWTACHDGWIYEPCGSPYCYGADTAVGVCRCVCHESTEEDACDTTT